MNRTITTVLAVLVAATLVATAPAAVAFADDDETETESDDAVEPGERLAGVVSVQDAEFDGEIDERAFGLKVANASSDEAKAAVLADGLVDVDQRLDDLEERAAELEDARDAGDVSEGRYQAEMAKIAAEKETAKRLAERSNATVQELPDELVADALESKGINASAIQTLKDRADRLGGEEVSEIARSIAGPDVGNGMGAGAPDGVPANAGGDETPGGDGPPGGENATDDERSIGGADSGGDAGDDEPAENGTESTEDGDDSTDDGGETQTDADGSDTERGSDR